MRKLIKTLLCVAAVAGFSSCNDDDSKPDTPQNAYEQFTISTADDDADQAAARAVWDDPNGKGNLIFNWEADETGTEVVAMLTGEDSFIPNYPSENP
ncbi:MAG: hypothetical protein IIW89_05595, partial [Alistipes sp.]|nr:hypothetical protein [Alistipes sp.]